MGRIPLGSRGGLAALSMNSRSGQVRKIPGGLKGFVGDLHGVIHKFLKFYKEKSNKVMESVP